MYMYVHIESYNVPLKTISHETNERKEERKNPRKKKFIYVLYEYLVFTSIIQYIIIIESKEKRRSKKKRACVYIYTYIYVRICTYMCMCCIHVQHSRSQWRKIFQSS